MLRRVRTVTVAAVVAALALAACGSSSSPSPSAASAPARAVPVTELVARSADATTAAGTARFDATLTVTTAGRTLTIPVSGAFDLAHHDGEYTMGLSALGLPGAGSATTVQARLVGGVLYLDMGSLLPGAGVAPAGGATWLELDLSRATGAAGANAPPAGGFAQADPSGVLDALRGVSDQVQDLGHETLDDVGVEHYRATLDLSKAAQRVPAGLRPQVQGALGRLGTVAGPADVWLDGQGRVRKLTLVITTSAGTTSVVWAFHDFGAPVDVQAPPPDQVTDFSRLFSGLLGSLGSLGPGSTGAPPS